MRNWQLGGSWAILLLTIALAGTELSFAQPLRSTGTYTIAMTALEAEGESGFREIPVSAQMEFNRIPDETGLPPIAITVELSHNAYMIKLDPLKLPLEVQGALGERDGPILICPVAREYNVPIKPDHYVYKIYLETEESRLTEEPAKKHPHSYPQTLSYPRQFTILDAHDRPAAGFFAKVIGAVKHPASEDKRPYVFFDGVLDESGQFPLVLPEFYDPYNRPPYTHSNRPPFSITIMTIEHPESGLKQEFMAPMLAFNPPDDRRWIETIHLMMLPPGADDPNGPAGTNRFTVTILDPDGAPVEGAEISKDNLNWQPLQNVMTQWNYQIKFITGRDGRLDVAIPMAYFKDRFGEEIFNPVMSNLPVGVNPPQHLRNDLLPIHHTMQTGVSDILKFSARQQDLLTMQLKRTNGEFLLPASRNFLTKMKQENWPVDEDYLGEVAFFAIDPGKNDPPVGVGMPQHLHSKRIVEWNADGTLRVMPPPLPGRYRVEVYGEGAKFTGSARPLTNDDLKGVIVWEEHVTQTIRITGMAADTSGQPVAGAVVKCEFGTTSLGPDFERPMVMTDGAGKFSLTVTPNDDRLNLKITASGYEPLVAYVPVSLAKSGGVVDVALPQATLPRQTTIRIPFGYPSAIPATINPYLDKVNFGDISVHCRILVEFPEEWNMGNSQSGNPEWFYSFRAESKPMSEGVQEFTCPAEIPIRRIFISGYNAPYFKNIIIDDIEPLVPGEVRQMPTQQFTFQHRVHLRLLRSDGSPLAGVRVSFNNNSEMKELITDSQGWVKTWGPAQLVNVRIGNVQSWAGKSIGDVTLTNKAGVMTAEVTVSDSQIP